MKELERVWNMVEAEIAKRGLNERTILALADAADGFKVRNAIYRASAEISDEVASKDLRSLVQEGLLVPKGERRGRFYIGSNIIRDIWRKSRETKIVTDPFSDTEKVMVRPETQEFLPGFDAA